MRAECPNCRSEFRIQKGQAYNRIECPQCRFRENDKEPHKSFRITFEFGDSPNQLADTKA